MPDNPRAWWISALWNLIDERFFVAVPSTSLASPRSGRDDTFIVGSVSVAAISRWPRLDSGQPSPVDGLETNSPDLR